MSSNVENRIIGIFGKKGTGKTTLMKALYLSAWATTEKKIVVIDTLHQFDGLELENVIFIRYDDDDKINQALEKIYDVGNVALFFDELDMFSTAVDYQKSILRKLFRYARNKNIDVVYTAKRISNVNKDSISNTDIIYVFQTTEQNDLRRLKAVFDIEQEHIIMLKKFEYLKIDLNYQQISKGSITETERDIIFNWGLID